MRIALVQDTLRMGGTERQTVALAGAFAAAGHEVLLLTFRPGGALRSSLTPAVTAISLQPFDCGLDAFAPGLLAATAAFRPDVVQLMGRAAHFHGWRLIRALPHTPVVATFRTGKPISLLYRHTLRRAAAIVANSAEAAHRLTRHNRLDGARVRVIRNAVSAPTPASPDSRAAIRAETGTPDHAIVFICVAMLRPEKQHGTLLHAAARLPKHLVWEIWIAGDGPERTALGALATRLGLVAHVRFLGLRHDVNRLYAAADLAVLASERESLPNFLVEAQWAGLPVIACDTGGVSETFSPNVSGLLVPPRDPAALANAMESLATDEPTRLRMATAAREFARREFDPARQNARYLDLFRSLT